ncbi:DUF3800 domain-containing protein [Candidatus Saccharibacteria bacterium]|nr:DUF3800 domain-containing protein [Candidatus Saccharibacteria bacterium]
MKIAIDESGDSGRKLWRGSSQWFVLAAAIVPESGDGCGPVCGAISKYREEFMGGAELHFAHNSHAQHVDFFKFMDDKDYVFAAVAIDKRKLLLTSPRTLINKRTLFEYGIDILFSQIKQSLDNPVVLIDEGGSYAFNKALKKHMTKRFGSRHKGDLRSIKYVEMVSSINEPLVQLADYIAGSVRHKVDDKYPSRTYDDFLTQKGRIFFA